MTKKQATKDYIKIKTQLEGKYWPLPIKALNDAIHRFVDCGIYAPSEFAYYDDVMQLRKLYKIIKDK